MRQNMHFLQHGNYDYPEFEKYNDDKKSKGGDK